MSGGMPGPVHLALSLQALVERLLVDGSSVTFTPYGVVSFTRASEVLPKQCQEIAGINAGGNKCKTSSL